MPSLKTALMTAGIMLVALFVVVRFAPDTVTKAVGLSKPTV